MAVLYESHGVRSIGGAIVLLMYGNGNIYYPCCQMCIFYAPFIGFCFSIFTFFCTLSSRKWIDQVRTEVHPRSFHEFFSFWKHLKKRLSCCPTVMKLIRRNSLPQVIPSELWEGNWALDSGFMQNKLDFGSWELSINQLKLLRAWKSFATNLYTSNRAFAHCYQSK